VKLTSQNRGHHWPIVIPQVNVSWDPWWCWLGITPDLSNTALWQSYQQRHLQRVGGMDEEMRILYIQYLWYVIWSLICSNVLWHGTSGFTSHPKEGMLQIFITVKNQQPLGPAASTLTTTPPRWLQTVYPAVIQEVWKNGIVLSVLLYLSPSAQTKVPFCILHLLKTQKYRSTATVPDCSDSFSYILLNIYTIKNQPGTSFPFLSNKSFTYPFILCCEVWVTEKASSRKKKKTSPFIRFLCNCHKFSFKVHCHKFNYIIYY
jgi:hypothetical protein